VLKNFTKKLFLPIAATILFGLGCTKIDTTTLGGDLIPIVDNVNTFADSTLAIGTTQGTFADTTRVNLISDHVLGTINNDPLFGSTKADIYVQLKPGGYPFRYGTIADTLNGFGAGLDSVVLCISYRGNWGDSRVLQNLQVKEINDQNFSDSTQNLISGFYEPNARKISYKPNTYATVIGNKSVDITKLKDTNYIGGTVVPKEKIINQIRIKLDPTFAAKIYNLDTSINSPFNSDSAFRKYFHGLAIQAGASGNALMYTSLNNASTRLEVHYRKRYLGKVDTVYTNFSLGTVGSGTNQFSATANNVTRSRSGFPVESPNATELYIQTTPGTYINLNIPVISAYNKRVIHRAELIVQQVPNNFITDSLFNAPDYLYLDLIDTTVTPSWKPIYHDLNATSTYDPDILGLGSFPATVDYSYFGGFKRSKLDPFGNTITYYNINITRHLQRIVTKRTPNYKFRLFAPYILNYTNYPLPIAYPNNLALGRVKIGSGTNTNYKMYLRVIYSNI
jgi:hypothetical protein